MNSISNKFINRILSSSNTRTKKAKLNIALSFIIKGISILTSLLLVPLTLGYLNKYEYGVWMTLSSILVWINYFDIGLSNGLRNKLAEAIANDDYISGKIYVSTTLFFLIVIVFTILLLFFLINQFINWHSILNIKADIIPNLNSIISILFLICCVNFVLKTVGTIYVSHQMPIVNDILNCSGQILSLLYIYVLTLISNGNFKLVTIGFTLMPIIVYFVAFPYTFYYKYKNLKPSVKCIKLSYAKDLGLLGVKFFFIQIACLLLFSTSNLIISNLFGPADVTNYNIAYKYLNLVSMIFLIIINPFWTAITDAYCRQDFHWIKNIMRRLNIIWIVTIICMAIMIIISHPVFKIWLGDNIKISYSLLISITIYIALYTRSSMFSIFANGVGKLNVQLILAMIQCVVFGLLVIILTPFMGVCGIAYSLAGAMAISAIGLEIYYKNLIKKY